MIFIIIVLTFYSSNIQKGLTQANPIQITQHINDLKKTNVHRDSISIEQEDYLYNRILFSKSEVDNSSNSYISILEKNDIRISSLLGLDVKTIVIDPGHGGRDPGTVGKEGAIEKDIVLDIALTLSKLLEKNDKYEVLLTRYDDEFVSLSDRTKFAIKNQADLFISLHINSLPQANVNLTETYFYGPTNDYSSIQLAKFENQNSGYSLEAFGELFTMLKHRNKEQESSILAAHLQSVLFNNINENHGNISDGGTKTAPFAVLLGAEVPAVLVEISCISNIEEEKNLQNQLYRRQVASYLEQGIANYIEDRSKFYLQGYINGENLTTQKKY